MCNDKDSEEEAELYIHNVVDIEITWTKSVTGRLELQWIVVAKDGGLEVARTRMQCTIALRAFAYLSSWHRVLANKSDSIEKHGLGYVARILKVM